MLRPLKNRRAEAMSGFGINEWNTVTVLGSQAVGRPDGRVAIRLDTKQTEL